MTPVMTAQNAGYFSRVYELGRPSNLRVSVIFTDVRGTVAALQTAGGLARDLGARLALVAAERVPYPLPLDEPQVNTEFVGERFSALAVLAGAPTPAEVKVYLCRDREITLLEMLEPCSVVVLGGRRLFGRNREQGLARKLQARGHQVILVDYR